MKNRIVETIPLSRYPGWTVRRWAHGDFDAVKAGSSAISPGYTSFTGVVGWVRAQEGVQS